MTDTQRLREIRERVAPAPLTDTELDRVRRMINLRAVCNEHGGPYAVILSPDTALRLIATIDAALTREKAESVVTEAMVPTNQALISAADKRWQPLLDAQWAVHDDPADMTNAELACALACRLGYLEAALSAGQAESDTKP